MLSQRHELVDVLVPYLVVQSHVLNHHLEQPHNSDLVWLIVGYGKQSLLEAPHHHMFAVNLFVEPLFSLSEEKAVDRRNQHHESMHSPKCPVELVHVELEADDLLYRRWGVFVRQHSLYNQWVVLVRQRPVEDCFSELAQSLDLSLSCRAWVLDLEAIGKDHEIDMGLAPHHLCC